VSSMFLHVERLLIFIFTALAYRRACACQFLRDISLATTIWLA